VQGLPHSIADLPVQRLLSSRGAGHHPH
jgi:hypothetical protein